MLISFSFVCIAAILKAVCDKWRREWELLTPAEQRKIRSWFGFNPNEKWVPGHIGKTKAYNKLFLKIGWKTTILSDVFNDGWHTYNAAMIWLLIGAISIMIAPWWLGLSFFGAAGIAWIVVFNFELNK